MSEKKDKEIKFQILTSEHLVEKATKETRKIELPQKQEIKKEYISKIEIDTQKDFSDQKKPVQMPTHQKIVLKPESLSGVYHPELQTFEETTSEKLTPSDVKPIISSGLIMAEKQTEVPFETSMPQLKETKKEEFLGEEIFYRAQKKDKEVLISKPKIAEEFSQQEISTETQLKTRKFNLLNYFFFGLGAGVLILVIIFLKPYQRIKTFISKKEIPQETTPILDIPSVKPAFPTPQETSESIPQIAEEKTVISELPEPQPSLSPSKEKIKIDNETKKITVPPHSNIAITNYPAKKFSFLDNFPNLEIKMSNLSIEELQRQIDLFLKRKEPTGFLLNINITFNEQPVPLDLIFNYFIKPTKFSSQQINNFKNEFSGNYAFMIYYTYTRRYPILIFEIKNPVLIKHFNENWEKNNMVNDMKTLFFDFDPGKPLKPFVSKNINDFNYRVVYFNNNYKIIWAVISNLLIYSATESGLEIITSQFK